MPRPAECQRVYFYQVTLQALIRPPATFSQLWEKAKLLNLFPFSCFWEKGLGDEGLISSFEEILDAL